MLAFLPWLNVRYAALSLVLALFVLAQRPGWKRAGWLFLAPRSLRPLALGAYHRSSTASSIPDGSTAAVRSSRSRTLREGLPGLLLDQEFGLLVYAPVFALAARRRWRPSGAATVASR